MQNRRKMIMLAASLVLVFGVAGALLWPRSDAGYEALRGSVARAEGETGAADPAEDEASQAEESEAANDGASDEAVEGDAAAGDSTEDEVSDERREAMKNKLSDKQYEVCFLKGTEAPFSGKFYKHEAIGAYHCAVCQTELFKSDTKFDSGTGWPSFWDMSTDGAVEKILDSSHGMTRWEVVCSNCKAHLGHVFDDGPAPSGLRYCINSLSLEFHGNDGTIERATDEKPAEE